MLTISFCLSLVLSSPPSATQLLHRWALGVEVGRGGGGGTHADTSVRQRPRRGRGWHRHRQPLPILHAVSLQPPHHRCARRHAHSPRQRPRCGAAQRRVRSAHEGRSRCATGTGRTGGRAGSDAARACALPRAAVTVAGSADAAAAAAAPRACGRVPPQEQRGPPAHAQRRGGLVRAAPCPRHRREAQPTHVRAGSPLPQPRRTLRPGLVRRAAVLLLLDRRYLLRPAAHNAAGHTRRRLLGRLPDGGSAAAATASTAAAASAAEPRRVGGVAAREGVGVGRCAEEEAMLQEPAGRFGCRRCSRRCCSGGCGGRVARPGVVCVHAGHLRGVGHSEVVARAWRRRSQHLGRRSVAASAQRKTLGACCCCRGGGVGGGGGVRCEVAVELLPESSAATRAAAKRAECPTGDVHPDTAASRVGVLGLFRKRGERGNPDGVGRQGKEGQGSDAGRFSERKRCHAHFVTPPPPLTQGSHCLPSPRLLRPPAIPSLPLSPCHATFLPAPPPPPAVFLLLLFLYTSFWWTRRRILIILFLFRA